jgi:hypothetical protein
MSRKNLLKKSLVALALVALGMLLSWALLGARPSGLLPWARPSSARAAGAAVAPSAVPVDPAYPGAPVDWYTCTPDSVATYNERIHIKCTAPASGGIWFFAAPTTNPHHAARLLSILSLADVAGRNVSVLYDPNDTSGTSFGCLETDCRILLAAELL